MTQAGFDVDNQGNVTGPSGNTLSDAAIAAIANYVTDADLVATVTAKDGTADAIASNLANRYYYITTTTGSAVTITSTNPNAKVIDKNEFSTIRKSAGTQYDEKSMEAITAVGQDQPFTIEVTKKHGATKLVVTDTMTDMTFNDDVVVKIGDADVATSNYSVAKDGNAKFTITFHTDYVKGLADDTVLTINYSGKVTSDALQVNPATNKATLTTDNDKTVDSEIVKVYNAKLAVTKKDGDGKALAGAGFVIKNSEGKYYQLGNNVINWVDSIDDATEYKSDNSGAVPAFTGLGAGTYTLVEKTVPAGYNKAADSTFTITEHDYTAQNLEQSSTVTNNAGSALPSTGGIGTTIFYVVGALLVIGCGIFLVARRRASKEEE
jgi:LPXTG-motif cell wall-anchored protein